MISLLISSVVGITFGVISALNQNTKVDYILTVAALIVASLPTFWFALMLVLIVSVRLGWLPATGLDSFKAWILPCVVSGLGPSRTAHDAVEHAGVIRQDSSTARSKGISETRSLQARAGACSRDYRVRHHRQLQRRQRSSTNRFYPGIAPT